jgi:glycosyltransferase involved in cell wall biosynthesis
MAGTNHSWAFVAQALARAMNRSGHSVSIKSTNGLEHFPDDLRPLLLPGYHSHPSMPELAFLGPDGANVALDRQKLPEDLADCKRPYDLELAYTILYQIPRRFYPESACKMVIWNFESSILPPGWQEYHRGVDYILPSSRYSSDIFLQNGVPASKLAVVPHGVYREMFHPGIPPFKLHTQKRVKFLHNAIPHHRKLHERVIGAYLDAFTGDDDVCLVLKTRFIQPSQDKPFEVDVRGILEKKLKGRANPPEIEVVTSFVPDIGSLYTACDAVVSMSACEGFCLLPQTEVDTATGPMSIFTVKSGMLVPTHNGRLRTVSGVTAREYNGFVISFRRLGDDAPFIGTPEHPHAVVPKNGRRFYRLRKVVEEQGEQPIWLPLNQLEVGDLVALPKMDLSVFPPVHCFKMTDFVQGLSTDGPNVWFPHSYRQDCESVSLSELAKVVGCSFQHVSRVLSKKTNSQTALAKRITITAKVMGRQEPQHIMVPNEITLTPEFGFFCGLYIAEGSPVAEGNAVHFASHADEVFGRSVVISVAKSLGVCAAEGIFSLRGNVTVSSKILSSFLSNVFGHGAYNKTIPMWLWNSPIIPDIIGGIFYGDGTCSQGRYSFSTSSAKLACDLRTILAAHGILCHLRRDCRQENTNYVLDVASQYNVRFSSFVKPMKHTKRVDLPNGHKNTAIIENEQFFFVPIRSLEKTKYHGMVHNLHVEEDHSFSVGGMATHNCLPLLEALACGSIVIAPRHGGQLDFLDDRNALLVNTGEMKAPLSMQYWTHAQDAVVGDPSERHCAELMRRVYADPAGEKARVAEAGRETVGRFTWEAAAKQIIDLAETCVAEKVVSPVSRKRRVLYVVPYDMAGGGEVWVREAIRRLDRNRYEPSIALPLGASPELMALFDDLGVQCHDLRNLGSGNALKCMIESEKPDVVHFYNSLQVYGLMARIVQEGAWGGKLVETVHSELMWPDSMMKVAARRGVSMIIGVSETICSKLSRLGNSNVRHLPQQVAWDRFAIPRSKAILTEIKCPIDRFTVGTVARLSPEKNIPMVLACAKEMPDTLFVIVGDGPQGGILKRMAAGLGNVVFAGHRTDVERFYAAFDAMLLPSAMEGMPLTILEAMTAGTPIVASKVGAIPEMVSDGVNGFLVSGMRECVTALEKMRNQETHAAMSENAKIYADIMRMRGKAQNINALYDLLFQ